MTASLADQSEARSSQLMAVEGLPARLVELVTGGDRALQTGTSDAIARLVMAVPNQVGTGGNSCGPVARGSKVGVEARPGRAKGGISTYNMSNADSLLSCHSCVSSGSTLGDLC